MTKRFWWGDFTTREFEGLDPDATIAVLPIAATEQHGPHLPVSTDHSIMAGMLETAFAAMPEWAVAFIDPAPLAPTSGARTVA